MYPTYEAVWSGNTIRYVNTSVPGVTVDVAAIMTCVGSVGTKFLQANIG